MALGGPAAASTVGLDFDGPGVSGSLVLTYGPATDAKYADAFEVTGISGTFSNSNNGLSIDSEVLGLVAVTHSIPESANLLAPHNFSRFAVASGLAPISNGFLTYDNLFWPGGSKQTASDYPPHGGVLDIYGLMFRIGDGRVVDLWSNGDFGAGADYGVALATADSGARLRGGRRHRHDRADPAPGLGLDARGRPLGAAVVAASGDGRLGPAPPAGGQAPAGSARADCGRISRVDSGVA